MGINPGLQRSLTPSVSRNGFACCRTCQGLISLFLLLVISSSAYPQSKLGRLVVVLEDEAGAPVPGVEVRLESSQTQTTQKAFAESVGRVVLRRIPFGAYLLRVDDPRFDVIAENVNINTEVTKEFRLTLKVRRLTQEVTVEGLPPVVDPEKTNSSFYLGQEQIQRRLASPPNRDAINLVAWLPGWVLEGNGVLHPRGSEYQTQYVIDGIPIFDNRSPAFASGPLMEASDSLEIMTGGIPAQFGRKLGGVVNVASHVAADHERGKLELQGGSYSLFGAGLQLSGASGKWGYSGVLSASRTNRYLDPPALENFHNEADLLSGFLRLDSIASAVDVVRVFAWANGTNLQAPNEPFQEEAGQDQIRRNRDSNLSLGWEHYFSSRASSSVAAYARHVSSELISNPLSTPVISQQDRSYQAYGAQGSYSWIAGKHQFKMGGDVLLSPVRESFSFAVADAGFFAPEKPEEEDESFPVNPALAFTPGNPFQFSSRRNSLESSFFLQDRWSWKDFTVQAGVRFDSYRFLTKDSAWSPRFGLGYFIPQTQTRFHFSYDRAFQTPSIENLLLSSSAAARALSTQQALGQPGGLALPPGRANFFEAGFSQALGRRFRIDGQWFRRNLRNLEDDDVFFNTGISFPISLERGRIHGSELRLELRRWGGFSGFASYSNLSGVAFSPITGGLFAGEEAIELLTPGLRFPISQDQRNTFHAQVQYQPTRSGRWWTALGFHYESGLPVELADDIEEDELEEEFSQRLLNQVNFSRGRIKPRHLWDASAGLRLWNREPRLATLQLDFTNLTNRLYLINFDGVFSGTAIGLPRTVTAKLSFQF